MESHLKLTKISIDHDGGMKFDEWSSYLVNYDGSNVDTQLS